MQRKINGVYHPKQDTVLIYFLMTWLISETFLKLPCIQLFKTCCFLKYNDSDFAAIKMTMPSLPERVVESLKIKFTITII